MGSIGCGLSIQDSINEVNAVEILEKYGWISRQKIGEKASAAILVVISTLAYEYKKVSSVDEKNC